MKKFVVPFIAIALVLGAAAHAEVGDSYLKKGNEYYHERQWDKAIEQYREVLKINPGHLGALHNLGIAYQSKKDFAAAIATFQKIKKLDRLYVPAYISLGLIYAQQGFYKKAQAQYAQAIVLEPDNLVAHLNRTAVLAKQGRYAGALVAARKGIAVSPSSPHLHLLIANIYFLKKNYAPAKLEYLKALKAQPGTPAARMMLALSLAHLDKFDEALAQIQIARNLDVHPAEVSRTRGKILALRFYNQKRGWKEAVEELKSAAGQSGDDTELYEELGDLYAAGSQYSQARRWYQRVLDNPATCVSDKTRIERVMQSWPKADRRADVSSKL